MAKPLRWPDPKPTPPSTGLPQTARANAGPQQVFVQGLGCAERALERHGVRKPRVGLGDTLRARLRPIAPLDEFRPLAVEIPAVARRDQPAPDTGIDLAIEPVAEGLRGVVSGAEMAIGVAKVVGGVVG